MSNIIPQLYPLATPMDRIRVSIRNPRTGHAVIEIAKSLAHYGQRKPIVVNRSTGEIEAGTGTYLAASSLGWKTIAAVFVEDDETTALGYAIVDNRLSELSGWDVNTLMEDLDIIGLENQDEIIFDIDSLLGELQQDGDEMPESVGWEPELEIGDSIYRSVKVSDCTIGQYAVRAMNEPEFQRLKASVKKLGILQPVLVRKVAGDKFEIVDGRQRFKVACELGMDKIPCKVMALDNVSAVAAAVATGAVAGRPIASLMETAVAVLQADKSFELASGINPDRIESYKYTANYGVTIGADGIARRELRDIPTSQLEPMEDNFQLLSLPLTNQQFDTISAAVLKHGGELPVALTAICEGYING